MKATYCFIPVHRVNSRPHPWRFASLHKASNERDAIIRAGGTPSALWSEHKDPKRPLRGCWTDESKTVRQILARLNRVLKREGLIDESIGCPLAWQTPGAADLKWWSFKGQLAAFAARGANEADRVDVVKLYNGQVTHLFGAKLWRGLDNAMAVANRITELLGA